MSKTHRSSRPKGFMEWAPNDRSREIVEQVRNVIQESRLRRASVRFVFYRLVGNYGYPKTERDYKNLAELLVKARRSGMIPFSWIIDSGTETLGGVSGYDSRREFLTNERDGLVDMFSLSEMEGQPYHVELWSEDAGSLPLLASIVRQYPVTVYSTGGFSSVTVTHQVAQRVLSRDLPTVFLHVGDYDPSGESIYKSMSQDVGAFVSGDVGGDHDPDTGQTYISEDDDGPDFRPIRVALTRDQTLMWDLETAPPKASDSRSINWVGETVQVQAMTEDQMEEVVMGAVLRHVDEDALESTRERSEELREEMRPLVNDALDGVIRELGEDR